MERNGELANPYPQVRKIAVRTLVLALAKLFRELFGVTEFLRGSVSNVPLPLTLIRQTLEILSRA